MKSWWVVCALFAFFVVLASPWTVQPAATQSRVRGWVIVDFRGDPATGIEELWRHNNYLSKDRWPRLGSGSRPDAAILSISRVSPIGRTGDFRTRTQGLIESFLLIGAASDGDLIRVEEYIERFYTHVDLFRVDEELR